MKLIHKISKTTTLDEGVLIKRIVVKIEERKYNLISTTDISVSFDDENSWKFNNWERAYRLDNGRFEIITGSNFNTVVFEYCPISITDYLSVIVLCGIFFAIGAINGVYSSGIISLVFITHMVIKYQVLKRKASEMLAEILI